MNDTSAHIARLLRERYARLTGAQRLLMGASMFDAARTMTIASFPKDLPVYEIRRRLCERFYGSLTDRVFPNRLKTND